MFARKVSALLKPNSLPEFIHLMEREILPWLRQQEGFLDLILLAVPESEEVATISFWDHEANAQAFHTSGYPEAVELLEKLLDRPPYVKTFDVVSSTFPGLSPTRRVEAEHLPATGSTQLGHRATPASI